MPTEFSDERLSAYLDGELPDGERAAFEQSLADQPEQQRALSELAALRGEIQQLPQARLGDDFTTRVVAAALRAQECLTNEHQVVRPANARKRGSAWNSPLVAIPALAAAALVAMVVFTRQWNASPGPVPQVAVVPGQVSTIPSVLAELRRSIPGPDEALVVRLRVPREVLTGYGVEAALVKSGIEFGRTDRAATANRVGGKYRQQVQRLVAASPAAPIAHPSEALFIEAPLEKLEATLAELAGARAAQPNLQLEMIVSASLSESERGEGEGSSRNQQPLPGASGPVAHRLNANSLPLLQTAPARLPQPAASLPAAPVDMQRTVRVLVLIETTE